MAAMAACSLVRATPSCAGSSAQGKGVLQGLMAMQAVKLVVAVEAESRRSRGSAAVAGTRARTILEREGDGDGEDEEAEVGAFCPLYSSVSKVSGPFVSRSVSGRLRMCGVRRVAARGSFAPTNGVAADVVEGDSSRVGSVSRETKETSVEVSINLDGTGICDCDTGIPFLDHMLDQLASHGLFDVRVKAKGDTHIDDHHTNEDVGLAMGTALLKALGDRKGIKRFGDFSAPLDEALVHVVLDLSGRPYLGYDLEIPTDRVGNYDTQLVEHFFQSMANTSGMTLHMRQLAGKNSHHIIEATFKAFARALRQATEYDTRRLGTVPSSKGVLSRA